MRSTFKILFYLNTSKKKKSGLCPIIGRITVDGGIAQFSLRADANPNYWNAQKGRLKGKSREQIELNMKIDQTEQSIWIFLLLLLKNTGQSEKLTNCSICLQVAL